MHVAGCRTGPMRDGVCPILRSGGAKGHGAFTSGLHSCSYTFIAHCKHGTCTVSHSHCARQCVRRTDHSAIMRHHHFAVRTAPCVVLCSCAQAPSACAHSLEVVVLTQVRVTINHLHNITIARGHLHLGRTKAELTPPKAHSKTHWVIPWPPRGVLLPQPLLLM